jgi:hypothetical protein
MTRFDFETESATGTASPSTLPSRSGTISEAPRSTHWLAQSLQKLAASPGTLLLTMLALNALFLPYRGRHHDDVLYQAQVVNRIEGGRLAGDLFFRFGSQDNYSAFSRVVAPLASAIGIPATFLLLYLAARAVFFWSLIRIGHRLVPDRQASTLGLLAIAVCNPAIGGLDVFHVNENFFTPRVFASSLVLLALERVLAGRLFTAAAVLAAAMAMHPLMAFPGVLFFFIWCVLRYVPSRLALFLAVAVVAAVMAVLLVRPLGLRLFGYVDSAWYAEVVGRHAFLLSTEWSTRDWMCVMALAAVTVSGWALLRSDRRAGDFLAAMTAVTLLGIVGSLVVCWRPYAVLVQGQPFRALWIAQTVQYPLAILLAKRWWASGSTGRVSAALLLAFLATGPLGPRDLLIGAGCLLALAAVSRRAPTSLKANWDWLSVAAALVLVSALQFGRYLSPTVKDWGEWCALLSLNSCIHNLLEQLAPGLRLVLALAVVVALAHLVGFGRCFRLAALVTLLVVQLFGAITSEMPAFQDQVELDKDDVRFVREYIFEQTHHNPQTCTVYWPTRRVDTLWFDVEVNSYCSEPQFAGTVFSRGTAFEGARRAKLAAPFEMDFLRREYALLPPEAVDRLRPLYQISLQADPPRPEDLLNLCSDRELDFVVARQGFPGLYAATNGTWFIYDCRDLRIRIGPTSHTPPDSRDTTGEQR